MDAVIHWNIIPSALWEPTALYFFLSPIMWIKVIGPHNLSTIYPKIAAPIFPCMAHKYMGHILIRKPLIK